jgi:hypothetical protein
MVYDKSVAVQRDRTFGSSANRNVVTMTWNETNLENRCIVLPPYSWSFSVSIRD